MRCRRSRSSPIPSFAPFGVREALAAVGPDEPHPLNLFRVHWHNSADRVDVVDVPEHLVLPQALTGVDARIVVALGDRFPLIGAHKVLAAYGCLAPRLVTGSFDPTHQRAVWPSTGNYCRGGVAISRLLGCRGSAVLPEGMSRERFDWLANWVVDPADVIRTPGTESNVKEIYDACRELAADPGNVILNQFSEFGNYLVHYLATGAALERIVEHLRDGEPKLELRAFVAATGSAGTIAAGDYLKERHGSLIVAAEALECPTLLYNGFGEHNIQGIGDKHVPLIHNVLNTDVVLAISDRATDRLGVLLGTDVGREHLCRRGVPEAVIAGLPSLGLSSICNVLGAIKTAKYYGLGPHDVVVTVATDGAAMYDSERRLALERHFPGGFDECGAAEVFGEHLLGTATDHFLEPRPCRARADLQPRLLHLGRAAGNLARGLPGAARPRLLERPPRRRARLGRADRRAQRPHRRAGVAVRPPPSQLVCAGCGATTAPAEPYPFRCPNAGRDDDVDHVLRRVLDPTAIEFPRGDHGEPNPFVRYRRLLHSYHLARAGGFTDDGYCELVRRLNDAVAAVDGHGFAVTPFARSSVLSRALGLAEPGGVWVKDETGNVSGSHKARHLFGVLVQLEVAERIGLADPSRRPELAIASCGNAALAAAVVAAAGGRTLRVFVPVNADSVVLARLEELGARIELCERDGLPGDPAYRRLLQALADGALPFTCQGNLNGLAVESGETLGWELVSSGVPLDRLVVQVGGGALASACIHAFADAVALGALDGRGSPRIDTVQTGGAWPLKRAFEAVSSRDGAEDVLRFAAHHRSAFMWPWEEEPRSVAHGILDDETYDWLAVVEGMVATRGLALVVDERTLLDANELARLATGIEVDHTGSAGLAGLFELHATGSLSQHERVAVLFTGAVRTAPPERRTDDEELPRTRHPVAEGLRAG